MQLYTTDRAPNPRRVHMFVAEKGLDLPRQQVNIMADGHRDGALLRLNPAATVPFLVLDDGTVIAETVAICRYLEECHPDPNLMGATPLERAAIEMWQRRVEFMLLMPIAHMVRHGVPSLAALEQPQVAEWAEVCRAKALKAMAWFDEQLADRDYMAGDRFTIADISALCGIDFARVGRLRIPETMPALGKWHERVSARPSASA